MNKQKEQNKNKVDSKANDHDSDLDIECDKSYAQDTRTCNDITRLKGAAKGRICHSVAAERLAQCRNERPEKEWPNLPK